MALPSTFTIAETMDEAFERAGVPPEQIDARKVTSFRRSIRLALDDWSNDQVKLFKVVDSTQALTVGDNEYNAPTGTIDLLDAYIRRDDVDTPLGMLSRSDWLAIPDKTDTGTPTHIWFERTTTPVFNLWPVPSSASDTLVYAVISGFDDASALASGSGLPGRWNEAFCAELTARMAEKWNAERYVEKRALAGAAYKRAKIGERERQDTYFTIEARR